MMEHVIPDIQSQLDLRNLVINKVGVKHLAHPIKFSDKTGVIATKGIFNIYIDLPSNEKGTHMSRFVEALHENYHILSIANIATLLDLVQQKFKTSRKIQLELKFDYFRTKKAPVSAIESFLDYKVMIKLVKNQDQAVSRTIKVQVPVTTLCPCSKEISKFGAHNQRSHIIIEAEILNDLFIEDLIEIAESEGSCELYGILKRLDEKYVTERAYLNPKFVEDIVRDVAGRLNSLASIGSYKVQAENFESIHNHSAFAQINR